VAVAGKDEQLERIFCPAGLDIGAEGPDEIAHAIVAETLAVRRRRDAGFLRRSVGPIHERRQLSSESPALVDPEGGNDGCGRAARAPAKASEHVFAERAEA